MGETKQKNAPCILPRRLNEKRVHRHNIVAFSGNDLFYRRGMFVDNLTTNNFIIASIGSEAGLHSHVKSRRE